jgi:hypothetical protein
MMKRIIFILAVGFGIVFTAFSWEIKTKEIEVTTGTTGTNSVSSTNSIEACYINTITFDVVTGSTTGDLSVVKATSGLLSTLSDVTLASKAAVASDLVVRPRVDTTTTDGTANTGDPPVRFMLAGENLVFTVVNGSESNTTFKALVQYEIKR